MITIDKAVPIPETKKTGKRRSLYPFENMEVNDSFLVPNPLKLTTLILRNRVNSAAAYHSKIDGMKFTVRDTVEGIRVWRTK